MEDKFKAKEMILSSKRSNEGSNFSPSAYVAVMRAFADSPDSVIDICRSLLEKWGMFSPSTCVSPTLIEAVINQLWQRYDSDSNPDHDSDASSVIPERWMYRSALKAWYSWEDVEQASKGAERILEEMESRCTDYSSLLPSKDDYDLTLQIIGRGNTQRAAERSVVLLNRMKQIATIEGVVVSPDASSFKTVIATLATCPEKKVLKKTLDLLEEMEQSQTDHGLCTPDIESFKLLLKALVKRGLGDAAEQAETILEKIEKLCERNGSGEGPDLASYADVINIWSYSKDPTSKDRAFQVFNKIKRSQEYGDLFREKIVYHALFYVLVKHPDTHTSDEALDLLNQMRERRIPRDTLTYTLVMNILAKSESVEAAEASKQLLEELEDMYEKTKKGYLRPNVRTYTTVIKAIARSREAPAEAESILLRMRSSGIQPDSICYNAVLNAWGWSSVEGKEQRCLDLLEQMFKDHEDGGIAKPDIISCNTVIYCCAFATTQSTSGRAKALRGAIQTLDRFQSRAPLFGWPDHRSFGHVLLAIARLMPVGEKRNALAEATFWQCCRSGRLSPLVINRLRLAVSKERLHKLLSNAVVINDDDKFVFDMKALPPEWYRFAPQGKGNVPSTPSSKAPHQFLV